jgi:hypothetical protein
MDNGDLPLYLDAGWSRGHYGRHPVGPWNDEECSRSSLFLTNMDHHCAYVVLHDHRGLGLCKISEKKRKTISKRLWRTQTLAGQQ